MKTVFADTHYWLAIADPRDQWKEAAKSAKAALGAVRLITTDEVLIEFLNAMSGGGAELRRAAVEIVRTILDSPNTRVVPQTRDSFLNGLERYKQRQDKGYSLTDCVSMNVMESESIREVLTRDPHFKQERFVTLY